MANERLGASFSIDVTNLKAGLAQANRLIRESESQFKAAAAGLDDWTKSEDGLNAKIRSLNDITDIQKKKIAALKQEYQNLINNGLDPTSREAVELRTRINNEQAALNSNEKTLRQQTAALKDVEKGTEDAGNGFSKFGEMAKAAGKVAAGAFVGAAAALGTLLKSSVEGYAEYEQLVGGVETLFKSSSDKVVQYANDAYKTAGLSANQYMETVTSFSASLLQGLEGNTDAAAEVANKAIIDMSDNANKMGTDMGSIMYAYQGFAKQNYTMLDNLKLGYGGTQTEMARLINDSGVLGKEFKVTAETVKDVSFDKIIEAIHVVQTELGITGTTAKEASTTIQGSISAMSSAWSNLVTGLSDETADLDQLITNFIDSVGTVAENLLPRITIAADGIIKMIEKLVPQIPPLIEQFLPVLVEGILNLLDGVVKILPTVVSTVLQVIPQLLTALISMIPKITKTIIDIIVQLIKAITEMLPTIVSAIMEILPMLVDALVEAIPVLLEAAIQLLLAIVDAIPTIIVALLEQLPHIIETIVNVLTTSIPILVDGAIQLFMSILDALPVIIDALIQNLPMIIETIITTLIQFRITLIKAAIQLFTALIQAIPEFIPQLVSRIPEIIKAIVDGLKGGISQVADVGGDLVEGLWNGIKDMGSWIGEKIKGFGKGVLDNLKSFFGIASPSKLMEDVIGKNLALGVGVGFEDEMKDVNKQIQNAIHVDGVGINARVSNASGQEQAGSNKSVVVYQTNNYSQAHSRYEIYKSKQQTMAAVQLALAGV